MMTRASAYFKLFPKAKHHKNDIPDVCFDRLLGIKQCKTKKSCYDCWMSFYEEDFEKAREEK